MIHPSFILPSMLSPLLSLLVFSKVLAQADVVPELILDINIGSDGSFPNSITRFGSKGEKLFFFANTPDTGREPWVTDGTAEGTLPLAVWGSDINPGEGSSQFSGPLADLGPENRPVAAGERVFFLASLTSRFVGDTTMTTTADQPRILFVTDGAQEGTLPVWFLSNTSTALGPTLGEKYLLFRTDDEIYITDGTFIGTRFVQRNVPNAVFHHISDTDRVLIQSGSYLGSIVDATTAEFPAHVSLLTNQFCSPYFASTQQKKAYVSCQDSFEDGGSWNIWVTDGTVENTRKVTPPLDVEYVELLQRSINDKILLMRVDYMYLFALDLSAEPDENGWIMPHPINPTDNGNQGTISDETVLGYEGVYKFPQTISLYVGDSGDPSKLVIQHTYIPNLFNPDGASGLWITGGTNDTTEFLLEFPTGDYAPERLILPPASKDGNTGNSNAVDLPRRWIMLFPDRESIWLYDFWPDGTLTTAPFVKRGAIAYTARPSMAILADNGNSSSSSIFGDLVFTLNSYSPDVGEELHRVPIPAFPDKKPTEPLSSSIGPPNDLGLGLVCSLFVFALVLL